ncbi:uncharacterized protein VNE69_03019 [Vairimorpha necatrix]|uniref:Uncharacterized protein n=1 Tax=Vairimorpha necatrix TaxID=6039 RepID=A0AAX4JA42_9MICR
MEEIYSTDLEQITEEINKTQENQTSEILSTKLELLQIFYMCYTLYKENENPDILKNLIKITELLKKCKILENYTEENEEPSKRILEDLNKKRFKKQKGNNPRKKYKEKSEKLGEKCKKKFDGNIK